MQTRSKNPRTRSAAAKDVDKQSQYERFTDMAREVEAEESPDALDRAFARLDPRKRRKKRESEKK